MMGTSARNDSQRKGTVAIVFWETYLGCAPSIINAARLLNENGFDVDILIRHEKGRFAEPPAFSPHTRVLPVNGKAGGKQAVPQPASQSISTVTQEHDQQGSMLRRIVPAVARRRIFAMIQTCRDAMNAVNPARIYARERFAKMAEKVASQNEYVCLIGVDTIGLVTADRIARKKGIGVIYWSLEIMFQSDFKDRIARRWKCEEKQCHQRALALVIQDHERATALCLENDADTRNVIIVPNSPRGFVDDHIEPDFFHRLFNLPCDNRVILHAGSVCEGMRSHELAAAAATWPSDRTLVFHSHTRLNRHDQYAQSLVGIGNGNVRISTAPVSYDELDTIFSSATIGLVIYDRSLGPNFSLLAGASGKLAHSLRCGVPVICVDNPSIGRVLSEHQCGVSVSSPAEIQSAIDKILAYYDSYQRNALACYESIYEFDTHFAEVQDLICAQSKRASAADRDDSSERVAERS